MPDAFHQERSDPEHPMLPPTFNHNANKRSRGLLSTTDLRVRHGVVAAPEEAEDQEEVPAVETGIRAERITSSKAFWQ